MRKGLLILIGVLAFAAAALLYLRQGRAPDSAAGTAKTPEKEVAMFDGRPVPEPPTSAEPKNTPLSPKLNILPQGDRTPEEQAAVEARIAKSVRPDPRVARTPEGRTILTMPRDLSRQINSPDQSPQDDIDALDEILRNYRLVHRTNPEGTNDEIITALAGENPRQMIFFDSTHPDIDPTGQLLDRWGQPFYFHALSSTEMEIWSGGPDGQRGNHDDVRLDSEESEALQLNAEAD